MYKDCSYASLKWNQYGLRSHGGINAENLLHHSDVMSNSNV